MCKNGQYVIID